MDLYTVEFRIYGDVLDIDEITASLGLGPTTVQMAGRRRDAVSSFSRSMWGYGEVDDAGGLLERPSLDEGISKLLKDLLPVKGQILKYAAAWESTFWCGHYHEIFSSGPSLSAPVLAGISELGASIDISTFVSERPEPERLVVSGQ